MASRAIRLSSSNEGPEFGNFDVEHLRDDAGPAVYEIEPTVHDAQGCARLCRRRLLEEHEFSSIVEFPRDAVAWEDSGVGDGRAGAILAKPGRVDDHRALGQLGQEAIGRGGLRRHHIVDRKGEVDATVDLSDGGESVFVDRRHGDARGNVAALLSLCVQAERQRHR